MITVILFSFLAICALVGGVVLWTSNANRRAGQDPAGNRKNPNPASTKRS
jgi:hypothetical protein